LFLGRLPGVDAAVSGRRIGYCRASTTGQDTALQRDALQGDGCERIFVGAVAKVG
jgi:DNA invertase Pin-like site-specific DNA recombinase